MMPAYNPETFTTAYETPFGRALWEFLNEPDTIARMETATALGRPAVEGVEEQLLARFEQDVEQLMADRNKQMAGHMVRQIMEPRGYVIDMQNVKVTNGAPFTRATRYKLPTDLDFYVYNDGNDFRNVALTADKAGARLPPGTKWVYWKSFRGGLRGRIAFGVPNEKVARADIINQGYHLYRMPRLVRKA
jgi:hypothetical protein